MNALIFGEKTGLLYQDAGKKNTVSVKIKMRANKTLNARGQIEKDPNTSSELEKTFVEKLAVYMLDVSNFSHISSAIH